MGQHAPAGGKIRRFLLLPKRKPKAADHTGNASCKNQI
jgi:hypothetical protein